MATYTIEQYKQKIQRIINNVEALDAAVFIAAKSAQSQFVERIFEEGKDSLGNSIGSYDNSKPFYIGNDESPKNGTGLGKPNSEGKSKKGKTTYYSSYADFRKTQGRESGKVNLRLFGRLQSDISNSPIKKEPLKYSIVVSRESKTKMDGNEYHFGKKIFKHSIDERKTFTRVLNFEIRKILTQ